jgi:hypothetical protein
MLCPSTDRSESTHVLGLADSEGRVRFLEKMLPIPREAVDQLTDKDMRSRVRLTGPCISFQCGYWKNGCSLGRRLSNLGKSYDRACPIVSECRWYQENGNRACGICAFVFHDLLREELEL